MNVPIPPRENAAEPTGCASAAARSSNTAVEPADHGPSAVPKIPRAAITARSNSVSKNSATKSATAIGPQRSKSKMPVLPRPRTPRPVFSRFHRSSGEGLSIAGGVIVEICAKTSAIVRATQQIWCSAPRRARTSAQCRRRSWRDRRRKAAIARPGWRENAWIGMQHLAVKFFNFHVAPNIGAQWADSVRQRGRAKPGIKLFRNGAAAHHFTPLQHQRLEPAFGQIKRGNQCVVPAADEWLPAVRWACQWPALCEAASCDAVLSEVTFASPDFAACDFVSLGFGLRAFDALDLAARAPCSNPST